jgi:cyclic di-GMP phosphodiesterase
MQKPKKVLIVEPDRDFRETLLSLLGDDCELVSVESGEDALKRAEEFLPDIAVIAASLPDGDGLEVCRRLKSQPFASCTQVIITSTTPSGKEQVRALEADADDYLAAAPLDAEALSSKVRLHSRLQDATSRLKLAGPTNRPYGSKLEQLVAERTRDLVAAEDVSIVTLTLMAEYREPKDRHRVWRKRYYASIVAARLSSEGPHAGRIDVTFIDSLYRATALQDIGKIGVADSILLKIGPLTSAEWEMAKEHTIIGSTLLSQLLPHSDDDGFLEMATAIARWHHEKFDGTGYPDGLTGEEIPLPARIVAVVDAYDALTDPRVLKVAESPEAAREKIVEESGRQFDPVVVEAFQACLAELVEVRKSLDDPSAMVTGAATFLA